MEVLDIFLNPNVAPHLTLTENLIFGAHAKTRGIAPENDHWIPRRIAAFRG